MGAEGQQEAASIQRITGSGSKGAEGIRAYAIHLFPLRYLVGT
jgi:hypothetical protein